MELIKKQLVNQSKVEINKGEVYSGKKNLSLNRNIYEKRPKPAVCVDISQNAKIIQSKHKSEDQKRDILDDELVLVYQPSLIVYYIDKYKMQHPVYHKKGKDSILSISVKEDNNEEVFMDKNIIEIIDDYFETYISQKEFETFKDNNNPIEPSNYYNNFSWNVYSELTNVVNKKIIKDIIQSDERIQLLK